MKKFQKQTIGAAVLAAGILSASHRAHAQFTASDLVVDEVSSASNSAQVVMLNEYTPSSATIQTSATYSTALASTGSNAVTQSGTASSEGEITLSANGEYLVVPGYNAAAGSSSVSSSSSATYERAVALVDATGAQDSTTLLGTSDFSGNNIRSAATFDGTTLYAGGANTGIVETTPANSGNNPTLVSSTATSTRQTAIFDVNNSYNLYFSTNTATSSVPTGIYQVGTGLPTTSTTATPILDLGTSSTPSPYGFSLNSTGTVAYVVDSKAGSISEYVIGSSSGTSKQTANSSFTSASLSNVTGLTVSYSGNTATIYVTTPTNLYSITDTVSGTSSNFGTLTTLANVDSGDTFLGVAFAPTAVPEPATWLAGALGFLTFFGSQRRRLVAGINAILAADVV